MKIHEIESILMNNLPIQEVHISGDGRNFQITIVGDIFHNMSLMERQKIIYKPLTEYITNNHIHALSIKAYTPKEWKHNSKINNSNYGSKLSIKSSIQLNVYNE